MVKYRCRIEIIADILLSAAGGATKKTRIMYAANLSHTLLAKYLTEIISLGLLRLSDIGYEVTEKGFLFLDKYERFSSRFSRIQKEMDTVMMERRDLEDMCLSMAGTKKTRRRRR